MATASPSPVFRQRFFDLNGKPLSFGKVYSYVAGSAGTILKDTYGSSDLSNVNPNPVILGADGSANIWFSPDDVNYLIILRNKNDDLQYSVDNIPGGGDASGEIDAALAAFKVDLASSSNGKGAYLVGSKRNEANSVGMTASARMDLEKLMPDDFLSVGATDDQTAFLRAITAARQKSQYIAGLASYWATPGGSIRLRDKGVYTVTDILDIIAKIGMPETAQLRIFADSLGDAVIKIPDGKYFSQCNERLNNLSVRNIGFTGGKGVFLQKYTGINVNGWKVFENCYFDQFTECAIASNAADDPYWRIKDCIFMGAIGSGVRSIALGGLLDGAVIDGNAFLRSQYHIVINNLSSGNLHITNNDFLSFQANNTDADIVIGPNEIPGLYGVNSGQASTIAGNKFGNENLKLSSPRILFAKLDTGTGTGRENRPISTVWTPEASGANYLKGIQFKANRWSFASGYNAPLMRSYVDRVDGVLFDSDNSFDGAQPARLVEWMGLRTTTYENTNWQIKIDKYGRLPVEGSPFFYDFSNYPVGPINDELTTHPGSQIAVPWTKPVGNESSIAWAKTMSDWFVLSGASKAAATGPDGGAATTITAMTSNVPAVYAPVNASGNIAEIAWLSLAINGGPNAVQRVKIDLFNFADGILAISMDIAVPTDFYTLCIPFTIPISDTPAAWQLRIFPYGVTAGVSDKFVLGKMHINTGTAPLRSPVPGPAADATDLPTALVELAALKAALQAIGAMKE